MRVDAKNDNGGFWLLEIKRNIDLYNENISLCGTSLKVTK